MKPSSFTCYPWNSVFKNAESEIVAQNIMKILKRTGDTFRNLTVEEYEAEREKDGNFSTVERELFKRVLPYCKSADTATLLSPDWKKIVEGETP